MINGTVNAVEKSVNEDDAGVVWRVNVHPCTFSVEEDRLGVSEAGRRPLLWMGTTA